jgi:hypothetical protein
VQVVSGQNTGRTGRGRAGPCDAWRERAPCGNSSRSEGWIRDLPRLWPEHSGLVSSPAHSLCRLADRQGLRLPSQWNHNAVRNGKDTEPRQSRLRPRKGKPQSVKATPSIFPKTALQESWCSPPPPQRSGGASESGACVGLRCNSGVISAARGVRWPITIEAMSSGRLERGAAARSGSGAATSGSRLDPDRPRLLSKASRFEVRASGWVGLDQGQKRRQDATSSRADGRYG